MAAKKNRLLSYPPPTILHKVEQMATRQQVSKSKIVNQALAEFFGKTKPAI